MWDGTCGGTQFCEALAADWTANAEGVLARGSLGTRLGHVAGLGSGGIFVARAASEHQKSRKTSGSGAVYGLRDGSIRKKIIGHAMRAVAARYASGNGFRQAGGAFALLQKPAREHGSGGFLHPLIDQGNNLLAEIGGVRKAREFVALQRIFGSGKKELPGWLGRASGHKASVTERCA